MVLTVNPAGLAGDSVYLATLTINATDTSIDGPETVRVGLWVGSEAPTNATSVNRAFQQIVTDPIRPYVYAHNGGNIISVYNIYTGALVRTIDVGTKVENFAISRDGSRLFTSNQLSKGIVPVNLIDDSIGAMLAANTFVGNYLVYVRIHGSELLLTSDGNIVNASSGAVLSTEFGDEFDRHNDAVAASDDGTRFCTLNRGLSPLSMACFTLDYTPIDGEVAVVESSGTHAGFEDNGQDIALSADGAHVYLAAGAPYDFYQYSFGSFIPERTFPGTAHPAAIELAHDGRIFAGADASYGPTDLWIYQPDGTEITHKRVAGYTKGVLQGQVRASGDGLRVMALTDDPALVFMTSGP